MVPWLNVLNEFKYRRAIDCMSLSPWLVSAGRFVLGGLVLMRLQRDRLHPDGGRACQIPLIARCSPCPPTRANKTPTTLPSLANDQSENVDT